MNTKELNYYVNEQGCHVCTSHATTHDGYVKLVRNKKNWLAHRYLFYQHHGEIPKGMVIMHTCDNPSCINIDHLKLGTQKDNIHDMFDKNRDNVWRGGRKSDFSEILPKRIKKIRLEQRLSQSELADKINAHKSYVYKIENNQNNGSIKLLNKIANVLNVSFNELFETEEKENETKSNL